MAPKGCGDLDDAHAGDGGNSVVEKKTHLIAGICFLSRSSKCGFSDLEPHLDANLTPLTTTGAIAVGASD